MGKNKKSIAGFGKSAAGQVEYVRPAEDNSRKGVAYTIGFSRVALPSVMLKSKAATRRHWAPLRRAMLSRGVHTTLEMEWDIPYRAWVSRITWGEVFMVPGTPKVVDITD